MGARELGHNSQFTPKTVSVEVDGNWATTILPL